MTGLRPDSTVKLEIVHGETDQAVVVAEGPLPPGATPTAIADLNFVLSNVVFPEEGRYFIRFWGNEHLLLMRPFDVKKIVEKEHENDS